MATLEELASTSRSNRLGVTPQSSELGSYIDLDPVTLEKLKLIRGPQENGYMDKYNLKLGSGIGKGIYDDDNNDDDTSGDLFGMNGDKWDNTLKASKIGLGAGQLGLGVAGFFTERENAKKRGRVLDQNILNNDRELAAKKAYRDALAKNFGTA